MISPVAERLQIFLFLRVVAEGEQRALHGGVGHAERGGHAGVHAGDFF